jgi:hypothetical protein
MKACKGNKGRAPHIFNLVIRYRWVVRFKLRPLYRREITPVTTGWTPEPVWKIWTSEKYRTFTGIRTPDRPVRRLVGLFMCFVWLSRKTSIISRCSSNVLAFINETTCVYCAVRTVTLALSEVNFSLKRVKIPPTSTINPLNFSTIIYLRIAYGSQNKCGLSSLLRYSGLSSDGDNTHTEFAGGLLTL